MKNLIILSLICLVAFTGCKKSTENKNESSSVKTKPDIEILNNDETHEPVTNTRTVHVRIKNNTDKLVEYIDLKSVYYDGEKKIVGTGIGNTANLAAGATKTIDVMAMGIENAKTYDIEIGNVMYK
jgi:hypothetical protein